MTCRSLSMILKPSRMSSPPATLGARWQPACPSHPSRDTLPVLFDDSTLPHPTARVYRFCQLIEAPPPIRYPGPPPRSAQPLRRPASSPCSRPHSRRAVASLDGRRTLTVEATVGARVGDRAKGCRVLSHLSRSVCHQQPRREATKPRALAGPTDHACR